VIHGPEVWGAEMEYRYSTPRSANFQAEARAGAHGGPEWPVGDSIQVITGIPDSTGFIRLLRCPDGVLQATS